MCTSTRTPKGQVPVCPTQPCGLSAMHAVSALQVDVGSMAQARAGTRHAGLGRHSEMRWRPRSQGELSPRPRGSAGGRGGGAAGVQTPSQLGASGCRGGAVSWRTRSRLLVWPSTCVRGGSRLGEQPAAGALTKSRARGLSLRPLSLAGLTGGITAPARDNVHGVTGPHSLRAQPSRPSQEMHPRA